LIDVVCTCFYFSIQFNILLFGIYEKVLGPTDIPEEEIIKSINPVSPKDLKSICMYIQQALDIRDHPAVNCSQ
jgi:hypothetical protein